MPVAEIYQDKTAFVSHGGLFRLKRGRFQLNNAPAKFQPDRDILLANYKWKTFLAYLDDLIVLSKAMEAHTESVDRILSSLRKAGISLRLRKCKWFTK